MRVLMGNLPMFTKQFLVAVFAMLLMSCNSLAQKQQVKNGFEGCWTHSYEEDTSRQVNTFRKCDFKDSFPPSRFRFKLQLNKDNTCEWLYLSPTDGHFMKPGIWEFHKDKKELVIHNQDGIVEKRFLLVNHQTDKLLLKPVR